MTTLQWISMIAIIAFFIMMIGLEEFLQVIAKLIIKIAAPVSFAVIVMSSIPNLGFSLVQTSTQMNQASNALNQLSMLLR